MEMVLASAGNRTFVGGEALFYSVNGTGSRQDFERTSASDTVGEREDERGTPVSTPVGDTVCITCPPGR